MSRVSDSYRARILAGTFKPTPAESDAIAEGYRAFMGGKSRRSNPYTGVLAAMFRLGWDNAERDAEKPKKPGGYGRRSRRQRPKYPKKVAS